MIELLVAQAAPARGAPLQDILPATVIGIIGIALLVVMSVGHRRGRFPLFRALGNFSERVSGLPGWAALPTAVAAGSLLIAVFGFYWDVSWHIDRGRDPGPLDNPAHWFIIIGLAGIALGGALSLVLGSARSTGASIRIKDDWHLPIGGVLLTLCGVIALLGFPLDDVWHRIFGQDVTEWGPTHIQMIGGASLATLAIWALQEEGRRMVASGPGSRPSNPIARVGFVVTGGAFLIGLSTLQGEFDFGVPQFRQLYHPVLIMLAAGIGLVAVRVRSGRGAAIGAVLFFLALRLGLAAIIGPVLGRSTLHAPLYLAEALLVELVALRVSTTRQIRFGMIAGAAIGTFGLAAEWAWSHVWMPIPWTAALLPEGAVLGFAAAVLGGIIGGLVGRALAPVDAPRERLPRLAVPALVLGTLAVIAIPLPMAVRADRAEITTTEVPRPDGRYVDVDVRLTPADAADDANWFNVTSWQGRPDGDKGFVLEPLREVAPGHWRTDDPVPADGTWKTTIRLQKGRALQALPVFLPEDEAIPADRVDTRGTVTRTFVADKELLQREAVGGSVNLERGAYALLGLIGILWIGALAWGLRRLEGDDTGPNISVETDRVAGTRVSRAGRPATAHR